VFRGWDWSERGSALFGADDKNMRRLQGGHKMHVTLRPGEKIVYRWDDIGKVAFAPSWPPPGEEGPPPRNTLPTEPFEPRFFGNSKFIYEPRLDPDTIAEGTDSHADIVAASAPEHGGQLAGGSEDAFLVYRIETPYVICGGSVEADFYTLGPGDAFTISASLDGREWEPIRGEPAGGRMTIRYVFDPLLRVHEPPAKYSYFVRIGLHSADERHGANLCSLRIETDVMAAPMSLPGLKLGENTVRYTDETDEPHEVTIAHAWQESDVASPPEPPAQPIYPLPDATARDSILTFRWPEVKGARAYHIQVSRRPDMRIPYRASYDVILEDTEWCVPHTGMFSPDVAYYWRVRAREGHGIWSAWGPVWSFRWEGPRVPVGLTREIDGREIRIRWQPNPRGPRPAMYEVYGSDEKGFSISRESGEVLGLGRVPGNFVASTPDTEMLVVSPEPDRPNMNRCYYRVVALDAKGTQSGCSDYVEMPHPFVYTRPITGATVGRPYSYRPETLASLGDLQYRGSAMGREFFDKEDYTFGLFSGPEWLCIDTATGALSGTPSESDVGSGEVEVEVVNELGNSVRHAYRLTVR